MAHLRGQDRQRTRFQAARDPQVQLGLPARQPLGRSGLQGRQLDIVTRGPKMFDRARAFTPGPHDLHRGGPRGGLHRPHVSHPGRLRPDPSVQIPPEPQPKPQLNEPPLHLHPESEPSQVSNLRVGVHPLCSQQPLVECPTAYPVHCFAVQARVVSCPVRSALTVCWLTVGWELPERGAGDGRLRSCRVVGGSLSVRV